MSLIKQAITGAGWLSIFKLVSQIISWSTTIVVTRLLSSEDYGLMEMATIFTGYIGFFVEFGISAALINKDSINHKELSSTFWFMVLWGALLSLACFLLAPVTVEFYNEPRLYHLTQAAGALFLISSLIIVPRSILHRELRFKEIGMIEIITIIFSCILMIVLAAYGAGPWTLIGGYIGREALTTIMMFIRTGFRPSFTLSLPEITPLLQFGAPVVLSTSLYYIYTKSDRFFGGRTFGAEDLGYYAVGLQLAAIPVEKIVSLLQSVLYPTLSKLKHQMQSFNSVYLAFVSMLALITFPLFIGGILTADQLVVVILGEKWRPAITPLKILLAAQLVMAISAPNGLIHAARGKPKWNLLFNAVLAPALALSFYFSAQSDQLYKLALPWIIVYPLFQFSYISITNRELGISAKEYIKSLAHPSLACLCMSLSIVLLSNYWSANKETFLYLLACISLGCLSYVFYFFTLGQRFIKELKSLKDKDF